MNHNIEEHEQWVPRMKTQQSARDSFEPQETLPFVDDIVSIPKVVHLSTVRFTCRKMSFQGKFFSNEIYMRIRRQGLNR